MIDVWQLLADALAARSTCARNQVGVVITNPELTRVLGVGYNGGARGAANGCDDPEAVGACGCLHAEINALLKASDTRGAVAFCTVAPCKMCAKALVNAGIARVVFKRPYRTPEGLQALLAAGVTCELRPIPALEVSRDNFAISPHLR